MYSNLAYYIESESLELCRFFKSRGNFIRGLFYQIINKLFDYIHFLCVSEL